MMFNNNVIKNLVKPYVAPLYERIPGWCFPKYQRRFQAYGIGLPKTGTTSLHKMFSLNYRSRHEPETNLLIPKSIAFAQGKIGKKKFTEYIKLRNRRLCLEMDSSFLNGFIVDILVAEFKEAKFILTIRDCYSWLDSMFNQHIVSFNFDKKNNNIQSNREKWCHFIYEKYQFNHAQEEQILADKRLYPLDSYLSYYKERHNQILQTVPPERLLIIKTSEINQSIPKMAQFLDIPRESLPVNIHANVRRKADKYNLLAQLDRDFVREKVKFHCEEFMCQYFPEVKF
jgi:hypothetical protein